MTFNQYLSCSQSRTQKKAYFNRDPLHLFPVGTEKYSTSQLATGLHDGVATIFLGVTSTAGSRVVSQGIVHCRNPNRRRDSIPGSSVELIRRSPGDQQCVVSSIIGRQRSLLA